MAWSSVVGSKSRTMQYAFVNYTDMKSMHDNSTYTQIRKHAMKQVGAAKRKSRGRNKLTVELFWVPSAIESTKLCISEQAKGPKERKLLGMDRITDDKALYDAFIRSLSCKSDPFETASVKLDAPAKKLLQYFMFHASRYPNTWTYSSSPMLPSTPIEHPEAIYRTVGSALRDTLLGNCLLATASARICYTVYTNDTNLSELKQKDLSLTLAALHLLQDRLKEVNDVYAREEEVETVVACMLHLGAAAFYRGDVATASTHIRAAIILSERIGGVMGIRDPYVRGRLLSFDDLISCVELRPCMVTDEYEPAGSSLSQGRRSGMSIAREIESCILTPGNCSVVPSGLRELILQLLEYQESRRQITASNGKSMWQTLANRQWLTLGLMAIRKRLLSLSIVDERTKALRHAILMWTLLPPTHNEMSQATVVHKMASKLGDLLRQTSDSDWSNCQDIHLWCLTMGCCCTPESSELRIWFAEEVSRWLRKKTGPVVGFSDIYDKLLAFQKRFLYHGSIQEPATRKLTHWMSERSQFKSQSTTSLLETLNGESPHRSPHSNPARTTLRKMVRT